jgi:hypothetical protein
MYVHRRYFRQALANRYFLRKKWLLRTLRLRRQLFI